MNNPKLFHSDFFFLLLIYLEFITKNTEQQTDQGPDVTQHGLYVFLLRPPSSLIRSSGRSRSACSSRVESRYLGSLKLLDHSSAPGQPQLEAGDSLRAAVYQVPISGSDGSIELFCFYSKVIYFGSCQTSFHVQL